MSNYRDNIVYKYVQGLGFSSEAAQIYQALIHKGPMTTSELARASEVERTAIYRLMPDLTSRGLVEELLQHKSRRYAAANPERIERLVKARVEQTKELESGFKIFSREVGEIRGERTSQTKYYRGVEGIKQILWNESKAKSEVVAYTYRNLEEVVGNKFFKEYAREIEKNRIKMRDLRSDAFIESMKEPGYERVHIEGGTWRYLPDKTLHLTHNMDIYDETTAIYYWEGTDIFGVEIKNQRMADMQRSIFETLWKMAKKI